jgi:DNA-binding response OmpR family regulator
MKKRLLLVDDDPGILEALAVALEYKYDVRLAYDGAQAICELERERFDAVVLDLMMPMLDGASVMRELSRRGLDVPVLVVSASNDVAARAQEAGAAESIQKPFELDLLERKLDLLATNGEPPPRDAR